MSSSEGEDFEFLDNSNDSDASDDFQPAKKQAKVPTKKAAPKAKAAPAKPKVVAAKPPPKTKAAPKKKPLAAHNSSDDEMDMDKAPLSEDDNPEDDAAMAAPSKKKKTASDTYQKLTQLEHILKRPDTYIGSVEKITQKMWTYDIESKRMVYRNVTYVPGFFKIIDEILVNAADNKVNDPSMDTIKVNVDVEEGTISVYNNGRGIPIEIHSKEKIYIPELIFGHLLAGSNYDDDEKRLTGGRNGYGAKLANIYSHEFTVETAHKESGQKYKQTWSDNMGKCGKAKITKSSKGEEYTRVSFKPDLARFGMDSIDEDTASLIHRRAYDMAGTVKKVKVYLNDTRLKVTSFKQYVDLYVNSAVAAAADSSGGATQSKPAIIHEVINDRWEIAFTTSDGTFEQVSFCNSIATTKGGTHVNLIADQISKALITSIEKRNRAAKVKPAQIKNHMWLFVNALIENPTFDNQTKETLTLTVSKFGGKKPTVSEEFHKKVQKSAIVEHVLNWAKFKADQELKKTDGAKRTRLTGLAKLSDANLAGTKHSKDCTLILTEGDSAKALAIAGLAVIGRDLYGVFPLRGKILNVREAKHDQIQKNEEIQAIKKIMGLQHNKEYRDVSSLRYGKIMIMTDQDHDGSHIKGLLINFLDHSFPSLLKHSEFLVEFVTPIVRVTKGNTFKNFFTIPEYERWHENTPGSKNWVVKYYKGLGTSDDKDARQYFSQMEKHMIPFAETRDGDRENIDLAFSKKKADERKEWLRGFRPGTFLDHGLDEITFSEFINKELILFSMADNIRSIPSVADGLKPGQRKILWGCFKRKMKKEIKVAQLVGYVAEHAAYHHGEVSLMETIIGLAQTFVGSNNLNLLMPNGQYGTRAQGGKDHAAPRYIYTEPSKLARVIFNSADDALLTQQTEENQSIEPEYYMPIIPMVLVNGADGIGTGWSTNIPCYNPTDIVANIRRLMNGEDQEPMTPWWRGFEGEIKNVGKNKYESTGVVKKINDSTLEITELPIHKWTEPFKVQLESMITGADKVEASVKEYQEHHDNTNVHFIVQMEPRHLQKAEEQGFIDYFKLVTKISTTNMICFNFEGKIKKYESPEEIVEDFYTVRLGYYQHRKDFLVAELQEAYEKLTNQARFIQMIVDKQLVVSNRKKADIIVDLRKHKFKAFSKVAKAKAAGETEDAADDTNEPEQSEEEEDDQGQSANDYDYLLGMHIWSLTKERIAKLKAQGEEKEAELHAMLKRTPKDLWNTDLDKLMELWEADCKAWMEARTVDATGKKVKKKQTKLRTRKSLGKSRNNDDDDDFAMPIKAALKKQAAKPRAGTSKLKDASHDDEPAPVRTARKVSKPVAALQEIDSDDEPMIKGPTRKIVQSMEVDSDDGGPSTNNAGSKGKGKLTQKRKSPDFDEVDDSPPPKKAKAATTKTKVSQSMAKRSPKAKPKRAIAISDEDEDDDFEMMPPPEPRGAAPRRAAAKPSKYVDVGSDDEDEDDDGDGDASFNDFE